MEQLKKNDRLKIFDKTLICKLPFKVFLLGDTCYMNKDYDDSKDFLFNAINCPAGIENPFIMLRLGETLYELGDVNKAKEYLLRAYILEGYSFFENE
ncbi:tetratricopeptide repeat protein [Psychrobacillus lasiicapitis]|uniref:tetratricopeptide repeat protein n=1 Tax=Psychrobacillus lasiicapitis TaxID=1636719 RepID=UPI0019A126F5|nr:hypothetical protein [Psychrobacillus lasiicapitis]GGA28763.1 hypothetical protein GCM10011384_17740 [Psychrobacillus lasiicapitis]